MISKLSTFQSFPKLGQRGGHQISNFFKNQNCHYPKGGGVKKIMDFFQFLGQLKEAKIGYKW